MDTKKRHSGGNGTIGPGKETIGPRKEPSENGTIGPRKEEIDLRKEVIGPKKETRENGTIGGILRKDGSKFEKKTSKQKLAAEKLNIDKVDQQHIYQI